MHRLLRNTVIVGLASVWLYIAPSVVGGESLAFALSMATAYLSLALLTAALCIGPWRVLTSRITPLSFSLRRDLGIWSAIFALVHVAFGFTVHMNGDIWLYFLREAPGAGSPMPRLDAFGLANDTGLVATVLLTLLLALSNQRALRGLGGPRWKALQRSAYFAASAVAVHAAIYQLLEKRTMGWVLACWALFAVLVTLQYAARVRRMREVRSAPER